MRVIFRDMNYKDHVICITKDVREGMRLIDKFAEERGYKIYYTRFWATADGKQIWEDFGSHTEFGILEMEPGENAEELFRTTFLQDEE